jgi:hypothetical protein
MTMATKETTTTQNPNEVQHCQGCGSEHCQGTKS